MRAADELTRRPTRYTQLTVRLPETLVESVQRAAQKRDQSVAAMVEIGLLGVLASQALRQLRENEARWKGRL